MKLLEQQSDALFFAGQNGAAAWPPGHARWNVGLANFVVDLDGFVGASGGICRSAHSTSSSAMAERTLAGVVASDFRKAGMAASLQCDPSQAAAAERHVGVFVFESGDQGSAA